MIKKSIVLTIGIMMLYGVTILSAQKQEDPTNNLNAGDTQIAIANGSLERCGIDAILKRIYDDPVLLRQYEENKKPLPESRFGFNRITCTAANSVDIPLAFHFDNSFNCSNAACILSEIQDVISTLNNDFGNNQGSPNAANCPGAYPDISTGTCINFYLAAPPSCSNLDPACDGAITIGQYQGGYNATGGNGAGNCWDDYLNVFIQSPQSGNLGVSDQIPGYLNAAGPGEGVSVGAPYFGGAGGACSPLDTDGTYNLGGTLAHEIGHYLGLPHIWGDVNGGGCGGDDGFADTPNQAQQYFGCPNGCVGSGCGGNQQTANFMNYTNDACMDLFTEDQAAAMNFYANQFFGNLNIPAANPTELYTQCTGNTCQVSCPANATSTYSGTDAVCASAGTYTLPASYPGLNLDDANGATYTWSTGGYLPGGTAINGNYSLTNPAGCNPSTVIIYLNVGCSSDNSVNINGGTLVLSVYPDPSQFTATDLATVSGENTCNEPVITPLCPEITVTSDAANPAFPVSSGQSGTANYTLTYTPPAGAPNCCGGGGGTGSELITNGDFENGTTGWTETEEVPSGTPNPNPFGVIGVSNSPVNGTNDAWFGGWGGTSTISISQNITIPATCAEANLTFDFSMVCAGNTGITLDVVVNGVVLGTLSCTDGASGTIAPFDLIAAGAATGNVTISFVGTEDGTGTGEPDIYIDNISVVTANCTVAAACDFPITANYNCAGCTSCNNTACTSTQACNDNDPCTTNDMQTILSSNGSICVPCAGTPIASCSGSTSAVNCNDGNPCTINDVRMVDDCDGSVCVPCAGTLNASSCNANCTTTQACNDGDPCTTNDQETVAANGSVCVPCAGTAIASCSGSTSAVNCNDGNPCTINDVRMVDDCDGSVCVPCAGTLNASSCNANCTTTQPCNDGNVCTTNDMETVAADGSICVPCAGTLNTSSCNAACTTTQSCNDGNPCTTNDQQTIASNGSICTPCAGTLNISSCNTACTTTQSCNDNNPCTVNDIVVLSAGGSVCTPCAGTLNTASCNSACTTTQACNDNNPCTVNDVVVLSASGSVCAPCAGTLNTASCNAACTTTQPCNDNNDCTVDDVQTVAANGSVCVACAGTVDNTACCANVNLDILFDAFPGQTSWDITDSNGNVVAASGSYSGQLGNSSLSINPAVCLNDGCYTLNFYDSLNNGMCPFQSSAVGVSTFITPGTLITPGSIVGTLSLVAVPGLCGNYNLTDSNGTTLASGGGGFGSQQIKTFCLNNGVAPKFANDDAIEPINKFIKQEPSFNLSIDLMPNPVKNVMTIYHHFKTDIDVQVADLLGKRMITGSIVELNQSTFQLNVIDLKPGIYFIQINSNEGLVTKKFIKE